MSAVAVVIRQTVVLSQESWEHVFTVPKHGEPAAETSSYRPMLHLSTCYTLRERKPPNESSIAPLAELLFPNKQPGFQTWRRMYRSKPCTLHLNKAPEYSQQITLANPIPAGMYTWSWPVLARRNEAGWTWQKLYRTNLLYWASLSANSIASKPLCKDIFCVFYIVCHDLKT